MSDRARVDANIQPISDPKLAAIVKVALLLNQQDATFVEAYAHRVERRLGHHQPSPLRLVR